METETITQWTSAVAEECTRWAQFGVTHSVIQWPLAKEQAHDWSISLWQKNKYKWGRQRRLSV
jgi:hypothetical protein